MPKDKPVEPEKTDWCDTGYVLVLEIMDNGKAGEFYIIDSSRYDDPVYCKPERHVVNRYFGGDSLCGKWCPFTVAKVENSNRFNLLKDDWNESEEIRLKLISDTVPDIVETGATDEKTKKGRILVGLFSS
jgi:hypothetical protein